MDPTVRTVIDVWHEWIVGRGKQAVDQLNAIFGAQWRKDQKARVQYSRRKCLIDEIRHIARVSHREVEEVVHEVENRRLGGRRFGGPKHINQMYI